MVARTQTPNGSLLITLYNGSNVLEQQLARSCEHAIKTAILIIASRDHLVDGDTLRVTAPTPAGGSA
jgi:hypothetical protein